MQPHERILSDAQWCVLDLLMRARQKGVHSLNRMELLSGTVLPIGASIKLAFAALTMPVGLVTWTGKHDFAITDEGVQVYDLRFGKGSQPATPSKIADEVIALPDLSAQHH